MTPRRLRVVLQRAGDDASPRESCRVHLGAITFDLEPDGSVRLIGDQLGLDREYASLGALLAAVKGGA